MPTRAMLAATTGLAAILALAAAPAFAQRDWDAVEARRYAECLDLVEADADRAYEEALAWQFEGGGPAARHCVAASLIALGQLEEGAMRLEQAALAADGGTEEIRAQLLVQSADAWMQAGAPAEAERALTSGLALMPGSPDLLIERGLARGLQGDYENAERDLSIALAERPTDVDALRLRAESYIQLGRYDEAERDIEAALAQEPDDIETLVVRGRLREARRTGVAPERVPMPEEGLE